MVKNMNEEEKEAIEYWKTHMEILHWNTQIASEHYIKVLLNLVEKQQKEIADIKMQNYIIRDMNLTVRLSEEVFDETYIRKDKIKEKIEEITSYAYTSAEERDCQDYAIQVLKELLGE